MRVRSEKRQLQLFSALFYEVNFPHEYNFITTATMIGEIQTLFTSTMLFFVWNHIAFDGQSLSK